MSYSLPTIPAELIQEIASYLPHTADIITCRSICRAMRSGLSTNALFKRRLVSSGWDIAAWEAEEREDSTPDERLQRWLEIDFVHNRALEFLEEIRSYEYIRLMATGADPADYLTEVFPFVLKMAELLPCIITHHVSHNIGRLTQETYHMVWLTIFRFLDSVMLEGKLVPTFRLGRRIYSTIDAFTRLGFCIAVLIPHCSSSFQDPIPRIALSPESHPLTFLDPRSPRCMMQENEMLWVSMREPPFEIASARRRTAACFTAISVLYIAILEYLSVQQPNATFSPPPPVILPRGVGDWSFKLPKQFVLSDNWERPWLSRQSMAALLDKITDAGCAWCGYYSRGFNASPHVDPPMLFTLHRKSSEDNGTDIRFEGTGHDRVGPFRIVGTVNLDVGSVGATKQYTNANISWGWTGIITPFGMVGRWGHYGYHGWWWIWPKEWSSSISAPRDSEN
ncbi:hypothetical protein DENSPDRAFT_169258 [Dentipellis sp. KUC8613]|nr:hypothetical protein DENSPDRAFT_169258 [Dentipellis sp. KUC8613]